MRVKFVHRIFPFMSSREYGFIFVPFPCTAKEEVKHTCYATVAVFLYFMSLNSWRCPGTTSKILDLFSKNGNYIFHIHNNQLNQQWCTFRRNHLYPVLISLVCMVYKRAKQLQAEWTGLLWSGKRSPSGKNYAFNSLT